jgi:hypothetical protein
MNLYLILAICEREMEDRAGKSHALNPIFQGAAREVSGLAV